MAAHSLFRAGPCFLRSILDLLRILGPQRKSVYIVHFDWGLQLLLISRSTVIGYIRPHARAVVHLAVNFLYRILSIKLIGHKLGFKMHSIHSIMIISLSCLVGCFRSVVSILIRHLRVGVSIGGWLFFNRRVLRLISRWLQVRLLKVLLRLICLRLIRLQSRRLCRLWLVMLPILGWLLWYIVGLLLRIVDLLLRGAYRFRLVILWGVLRGVPKLRLRLNRLP
jgi:hypothetical protein